VPAQQQNQVQAAEQEQANLVAGLLAQSVSDRGAVVQAAADVNACGPDLVADAQTFTQAATGPDDEATSYKQEFAGLWDSLADEYGLTAYQWDQL
jgi:hypothetical protein